MKEQNRPVQLPGTPPPPPPQFKPSPDSPHPKKSRRPLAIALCAIAAVLVIAGIGFGIHTAIRFAVNHHETRQTQSESITISGKDKTQQNSSNSSSGLTINPVPSTSQYSGKWVGDTAEYEGISLSVKDIVGDFVFILYDDGTCEVWLDDEMETGSWKQTSDGFQVEDEFDFVVNGQEANLYYDGITMTFVKQNT